jgi:diguanylate cyclase (GGDEF)-like protein
LRLDVEPSTVPSLVSESSPRQRRRAAPADAAPLAAAAFLLSSAALIYLSLAVPGYIRADWSAAFALSGLPCIALGASLLRRRRLGRTGMAAVVLFGDVAIVLSGYASADRDGTTAGALLSLPTLFTATFLPPRWLPVQVAVATACAWVINTLVPAGPGVHVIRTAVLVVACSCPAAIVVLLRRQLDRAVVTDPLTGLLNRRGLDLAFPSLVAKAARSGVPVAVLLADVDHFKQVNDELGHQVGDEVLRLVADATVSAVRSEDVVVRFGGEELAVVLVAPADHVRDVARRIRREVEQMATPRPVTVSIGAAWAPAGPDETGLLDLLIRQADDRMYEAKRSGRNRAVFADDAVEPAAEPDGR